MGKLQENELTKKLIDTFDEYRDSGLLEQFLSKLDIKGKKGDLKNLVFDNFSFFQLDENQKREIDGIIKFDSTLIFIEAKRGSNKFDKTQLLNEFAIGNKIAQKEKFDFYLLTIDEHIVEPSIIETIRNSSYAQIRKEQIKWISWYEITDLFSKIYEKYDFGSENYKYIFGKRLKEYKEQGFNRFEGFNKSELATLSKADEFLNSLTSISNEINNFVKSLQREIYTQNIIRLYKKTEHKRIINNKKTKITNKTYHIFWEQQSFGINHKVGNIPYSYTFPFIDKSWQLDLSKDNPDFYLFITFDFVQKNLKIGFRINKQKNIKNSITNNKSIVQSILKNRTFNRKSMAILIKKGKEVTEKIESKNIDLHQIEEIKKSIQFDIYFEYQMLDSNLFEKINDNLLFLRDFINTTDLYPKYSDLEKVDVIEADDNFQEDEINNTSD